MMTLAVASVFRPRIGHSLALSRPWSHSTWLFAYRAVLWNAPGRTSSMTCSRARSVTTSSRAACTPSASVKNPRAAGMSRRAETYTSITCPCSSTARVHIPPDAADPHVGLVDEPASPHRVPARACRVDSERGEVLHPAVQGDVIDLDPALRQELLEIAVGQAKPQIPAHGQQDHLGLEPVAVERRRPRLDLRAAPTTPHPDSLAPRSRSANATAPLIL